MRRLIEQLSYFLVLTLGFCSAFADDMGGQLPWEGPLQTIASSISGPVAMALGVIAVVITGLAIAFGEAGSGVRRLMQVLFGLAIAFTAASLIATLFHPAMDVGGVY